MDRIDAYAHVLPREFIDLMKEAHPTDELTTADVPHLYDHEKRLRDLDDHGIDKQVLTLARPTMWRGIDPEAARPLVEAANDAVRAYADRHPDRYVPVATLPFVEEAYLEEFERCMDAGMAGVQIFSHAGETPVDSAAHRALYERVVDRDVPVWIHPQLTEWQPWDSEYMLHKMFGWPFDTSLAMGRLVFGGVFEEYPDLKVVPHHMGAMVPHFIGRIEHLHRMCVEYGDMYPFEVRDFRGEVREQFGRFYGDTAREGSAELLEDGLEFYGEDGLVFGTDYPFGPEKGRVFMRNEVEAVEGMDVSDATKAAVFGGNIDAIL